MKKEYAEEVAAKIIEQLEQGTAPWQKPWKPGELTLPYNAQIGKEYRGINSMWLAMQGHSDPRWMTYNQASDAGAQVRKGSKGTKIMYWKFREERQAKDEQGRPICDEEGKPKMVTVELERPRAFYAVVFNAEQIDGLPPLQPKQAGPEPERHARAEAVLLNSGANIQHTEGDRAFYRPSTDSIILPARHQFPTADAYYATALHELGHWTGHLSRLDRDLSHPFGSEGYAKEELRAEIASLMLGERMDIGHDPGQHVAYVGSWIKALKEDPKEIFRAASDAEKITGFVMTFEQEQEQMKEQEQGRGDAQQQENAVIAALAAAGWERNEGGTAIAKKTFKTGNVKDTVLAFITDGDGINRTLQFEFTSEGRNVTDTAGALIPVAATVKQAYDLAAVAVEKAEKAIGSSFVVRMAEPGEQHYSDKTLQALVENYGWEVAYSGQQEPGRVDSVRREFDGVGPMGTGQTPYGERNLYAGYNDDGERRRYITLKLADNQIADMDGRDATPADVARIINLKAEQYADEKRVANGLEPLYAVDSPALTMPREGEAIRQEAAMVSLYDDQRRPPMLPDDPNELRDQANRGELRAIQRSSNIDMVPVADIEIGLRFRDLLRDTAQRGDAIGADAKEALDYYANAYAMNKTREEMKSNGATAEDMTAEENKHWLKIGFDIRTGTGTGGERALLGDATPTETALMLRSLSDGDRPEVMPEPRADDPEAKLRAIWDKEGVPKETQDALIAEIEAKAKPGARVGPFVIPGGDADAAPASSIRHHPPENPMPDRTYLAVPYAEKEQAKASAQAAGFKLQWDKENKAWFAPVGADLSKMEQWKTDSARVQTPTTKSAEDQFADALKGAGLIVDGLPVMDGKIHRVPVAGDQAGELSGAYAGHMEGRMPGGYIQNYKTGERVNWKAEGNIEKASPEERVKLATEAAQRQQRRTSEAQAKYEATAKAAATLWSESPAATAQNPYCIAKGIDNPGAMGLRVVPDVVSSQAETLGIKIAKTAKEAKELREADPDARVFKSGDLLVPGHDEKGKLWTLQSVNPYFKSFMKGGRKHALFTVAGANPDGKTVAELLASKDTPIVLAEGYATADTVAKLSSQPVIVAFDSGNLNAVAETMRQQFPERIMIVAADNDHRAPKELGPDSKPRVNVGLEKAKETAKKYGAGVAAPQFKEDEKGSDWNDIKVNCGFEASKKMLTEQLALAKREAAIMSERLVGLARTREMEARNNPTTSLDDAIIAAERGKAVSTIISSLDKKKNSKEEIQQSSHPQRVKSIIRDIDAGF